MMKKVLFAAAMMLTMGTTVATSAAEKVSLRGQASVEMDYQTINIKDLPQAVQDAIAAKYPELTIKEAAVEEVGGTKTYNITSRRNIRLLAVQPEIRWWPEEALRGHFIGLHTHVAGFNIALDDYARYQDPNHALWGLGLSYGYALPLGRAQRWGLEFTLGAGFAKYRYDAYRNRENGQKFASGSDCYWGITRAGITLSYKWDLSRKNPKN